MARCQWARPAIAPSAIAAFTASSSGPVPTSISEARGRRSGQPGDAVRTRALDDGGLRRRDAAGRRAAGRRGINPGPFRLGALALVTGSQTFINIGLG